MINKKILALIWLFSFFSDCRADGLVKEIDKPVLLKLPFAFSRGVREPMENTPVLFNSRLLLVANFRPSGDDTIKEKDSYLYIDDLQTGTEIVRFGAAHSLLALL